LRLATQYDAFPGALPIEDKVGFDCKAFMLFSFDTESGAREKDVLVKIEILCAYRREPRAKDIRVIELHARQRAR
jgi:hypothetical protein